MIPIGELRRNNLLMQGNDIATVMGLPFDDFIQYSIESRDNDIIYGEPYESFEPIELTEEWLIKFGFERKNRIIDLNQKIPVWALYSFSLTIWDDGRLFYDWIGGNIEVQHLHHLQNIYSDLLRKELTIKS